jgi:dTDP-4-dehydrorhamnose reductase
MKIGITGASGMLGSALLSHLSKKYKLSATSRSKSINNPNIIWSCFDITNIALLEKWLKETKPDLLIHCAAIVNVEYCEKNENVAMALHVKVTQVIVNFLNFNKSRLIYISTDSVFDGEKKSVYNESDIVSPLNIYSKTKLMGEESVQLFKNNLILRTNIVGWTKKGNNSLFEWILQNLINKKQLDLFHDVYFSPISVYHFSILIEKIIEFPIYGIYHCGSRDKISKFEFGEQISKSFNLTDSTINEISVNEMQFKAMRPKNMALNIKKITKALDFQMPSTLDCINIMKQQYEKNNNLLRSD